MIAGNHVPVNTGSFTNDMSTFRSEDDVLTLLIHLGYLGYDSVLKSVFIPNSEVQSEYVNAVSVSEGGDISVALKNPQKRCVQSGENTKNEAYWGNQQHRSMVP